MNKKIAILLLTIVQWSAGQAQFLDTFSDGDFSSNPTWMGDDTKFVVESGQLRLMAAAESSSAHLSTDSRAIASSSWTFYLKMDFNPSSTNLARVYLVSDQQNLGGNLNGYYVQLGGTDDEVTLYRQTGSTRTKIIDGRNGILNLSAPEMMVRVTHNEAGLWELFSDVGITSSFVKEGEVTDVTHTSSNFFGVFCLYTSTRSTSFYFDDFEATGETIEPTGPSQWKDIILTEIYADPSSSNGLPNAEYVELFNHTEEVININGWKLSDAASGGTLTGTIEPKEYVIITTTTAASNFSGYGKVMGISGFPSLNNAGDVLTLKDNHNNLIDSVNYTDAWYKDANKKSGGWSLELIDPENPCGESENWIASEDVEGGTPGKKNSVFANKPDLTSPVLLSVIPQGNAELILVFNEKLKNEIPLLEKFELTPSVEIVSVQFANQELTKLRLQLNQELQSFTTYTLRVSAIRDCNGNAMEENTIEFGLPEIPNSQDVVINEILFNPRPTGVDFVELYNPSNKYFNLKNWALANLIDGNPNNIKLISTEDMMLRPGEYKVITTDPETIVSHYPGTIRSSLISSSLPSLPDDEGSIALLYSNNATIDSFQYTDDMHSVFIKDDDGVSLERIATNAPTQSEENWKSASSTVGFATPGFINSNSRENPIAGSGDITVNPEIFIPITGQPDFTEINYQFDQGGLVANIKIVNSQGILIKQIANNEILGTQGFFRWDGDQENGSKARVGYYVVWFQVFDARGEVKTFRKRVVVAAQF